MQPESVAVLVARNVMLVATFAFAAWRLWRLPEALPNELARGAAGDAVRRRVTRPAP